MIWLILTILLSLLFLFRAFFILIIYPAAIKKVETNSGNKKLEPVSVIIAARNEEENLRKNLRKVLEQDYPEFQVVVVDDSSEDNTHEVLESLASDYTNLYHTWVPDGKHFRRGKKIALNIGIKAAKYDRLIFTDADCYPSGKNWLKEMDSGFSEDIDFVLGYGAYENRKGFLNKLVRFDALNIALTYGGMSRVIKPYMGVGRNMAYKKTLWKEVGGFRKFSNTLSGDDDLFVNYYALKKNTKFIFSEQSKTISYPPDSFIEWIKQKGRHISSSKHYNFWLNLLLALKNTSTPLTVGLLTAYFFISPNEFYFISAVSAFAILRIIQSIIMLKAGKISNEKSLVLHSPFFDLFLPLIYIIFVTSAKKQARKKTWK